MDLKQMADECGLGYLMDEGDEFFEGAKLITLAEMISAAERESCAKAAEGFTDDRDDRQWVPGSLYDTLRRETAEFIRKRSNA